MADPSVERLFSRVFICMKCNASMRADAANVKAGKIKCRKCNHSGLRPKKRTKQGKAK